MTTPSEADILSLEDRRFAAQIAADETALEELLAPDLRYTHSNAITDDKATYIESITSGRVQYKKADRFDTEVVAYDGVALACGRADMDVDTPGGARVIRCRYTAVWVERDNQWQFAAWQSTSLPN